MREHRLIFTIILCLFISGIVFAQPRGQQSQPRVVFFETVLLPSENENITRLDINYRVMKNFFVFTRASDRRNFEGGYELSIELFDTQGQSRGREIVQKQLISETPTIEFPNIEYVEGGFSFDLLAGEYRFLIRLDDRNSQRRYVDRDSRITIPSLAERDPVIHDILFIQPVQPGEGVRSLRPVNLGGNLFFGEDAHGAVFFRYNSLDNEHPEVAVSVYHVPDGRRSPREISSDTVPKENIISGTGIETDRTDGNLLYTIVESDDPTYHAAVFPLHGETLDEGRYRIRISVNGNEENLEYSEQFSVVWVDKPSSLRNIDFALEMLEYIVSPEEYRNIRRGSSDERRRKFFEYWREKDPDPQTAYNPVMTEFYRRVDYAAREFTTLHERNGARTDRGRVYILYGPPTSKDRSLTPGQAPQETWIYEHLNQKFIFVDQSRQGNYRLSTREEL